ncbi:Membrane-bound lytic murein transglycosylase D precursor [Kluyvera cryocrescens]|uniref:Membrane-bound lytic murein transglycosylase D n=1 Tax=Kluyvera cryocrescens TaxID=580 RepID=A0A485ANB7_KLUCR|nr:Membrane-bound lytic murein transglycosylase D precursor [Kluyvera cryocrescens]
MYWIAEQVKKRNMPMELVLLPIVESAFDRTQRLVPMPQAFGRSFRAQGEITV